MSKKIIVLIIIGIIVIGFLGYRYFKDEEDLEYQLITVVRGDISQKILETGIVEAVKKIDLSFQNFGQIEKIYVKTGQEVKIGQNLAKLDTSQLKIQLTGAEAELSLVQAKLDRLLAGTSQEEIKLAETAVANAEITLFNAKKNLEDIKTKTNSDINQAYENALTTLNSVYLKLDNAFNTVDVIQRTYFIHSDQEGLRVRQKKNEIENALNKVKDYIEVAKNNSHINIDIALAETKSGLTTFANALAIIRDVCETSIYRNLVSSLDKNSLDVEKININTGLTNIVNSRRAIFSIKLINEISINTAQAKIDSAAGQLQSNKDTLAIKKAGARQVDIALYNAQIEQSQVKINLLKEQLAKALLKSPIQGKVVQINKKPGETVQIIDSIISLISVDDFQLKVDIYEEDIVMVSIGNPVDIMPIAFPNKIFKGKVISIDPIEKLIGGVVYYEITINFEEKIPEGLKPGMTTDVAIKVISKENVLIIPENAIQEKNNEFIVQVFKDGLIEDRVIKVGLRDDDNKIEILSGLQEGEKVVIQ